VDFPPFVAIVADISRFVLGDSPVALRFFPALAGALVVVDGYELLRVLHARRR
jgi:4-amino-4-deoxy-L-arabinose transferase-like glycosyltransferase